MPAGAVTGRYFPNMLFFQVIEDLFHRPVITASPFAVQTIKAFSRVPLMSESFSLPLLPLVPVVRTFTQIFTEFCGTSNMSTVPETKRPAAKGWQAAFC